MAEDRMMMTAADVVAKAMGGEHGDLLRDAVSMVVRELMEAEVAQLTGADRGERSEGRVTNLNGYRSRLWETRVGDIELAIPRTRSGPSYFPSFVEPRRRCEQAIVAVVMEAYVNGVSTRKVDRLVDQLGIGSMSKARVSRMCQGLDPMWRLPGRFGLTVGAGGRTLLAGVCLAGEWLRLTPGLQRRSGHGRNDDVGGA